jgi:hypothetical protein
MYRVVDASLMEDRHTGQRDEGAMPDFDPEALKRSLQHYSATTARNRLAARRSVRSERAAVSREMRQETIQILENTLAQAGVDVRKLRAELARNRKRALDVSAPRRPRAAAPSSQPLPPPAPMSGRFHSLQPLAGRAAALLSPPTIYLLSEPFFFTQDESGSAAEQAEYGPFLKSLSLASGNTFFQANVVAFEPSDYATYTFWYLWHNDSDTPMLTKVMSELVLNGLLYGDASSGYAKWCWEAQVSVLFDIGLGLGSLDNPGMQVATSRVGEITADDGFLGLELGEASQAFANEAHDLVVDGFLVPPRSTLVIQVYSQFTFQFAFFFSEPTGIGAGNSGEADFAGADEFGNAYRITCPGVLVMPSPVQI